jgi:hypothetical protein
MGNLRKLHRAFARPTRVGYVLVAVAALAAPAVIALASTQLQSHSSSVRAQVPALRASGHAASSGSSAAGSVTSGPTVINAVAHGESPPVWSLPPIDNPQVRQEPREFQPTRLLGEPEADGAVQESVPAQNAPSVASSFDGISNLCGCLPPDVSGDVGPNHYVEALNGAFAVYSKAGATLKAPTAMVALWSGLSGGLCKTHDDGDPIVVYDRLADRWLISQFAWEDPDNYHECIAISKTPDPTGAYWAYDFKLTGTRFNDYPKFGVWPDGYYASFNDFDSDTGFGFAGVTVVAFNRAKMLTGDPTANGVRFVLGTSYDSLLPSHLDSRLPPPANAPNLFLQSVDSTNSLKLYAFHADYATPASSTFTSAGTLAAAAFDSSLSAVPQPSAPTLDALADRPMQRLEYRNLGGAPTQERLVVNQTVNAGSGRAGVRWYELRGSGGTWSIGQQSTFAPADTLHRWMGSAAMDGSGDIAVGYSASSSTLSPSIRYTGRTPADAANTLQAETIMQAGGGVQTSSSHRWGDYTTLSVDPVDDCTFWYAGEYYSSTSNSSWKTRIGSFRFPNCVGVSSFSPASGAVGSSVNVTGVGFSASSVVSFNGAAASTTFNSPTSLTALVPAGATTGRISVATGTNSGISANNFTVTGAALPSITAFSPASGITGSSVTITGVNLTGASAVTFNGLPAASFTVTPPTQIVAKVPNGATAGAIKVTTAGGIATSATSFTPTLSIQSFSPAGGPVGTTVTLNGVGFTPSSVIRFSGIDGTGFTFVSANKVTVQAPAGFATGKITLKNTVSPVGTVVSAKDFYRPPTVSSLNPTSGATGSTVTISGTSLLGTTKVRFSGVQSPSFKVQSPTSLTAKVPNGITTGNVSVGNPGGTASGGTFTVTLSITGFSPASGPVGTTVSVNGVGFTPTSVIRLNGTPMDNFVYVGPNQVKGNVPATATSGKIRVTNSAAPVGAADSVATFTKT